MKYIKAGDANNSLTVLNDAIKEHYILTEKILCFSLLGERSADYMLQENAHLLCHFSKWIDIRMQDGTMDKKNIFITHEYHKSIHNIANSLMSSIQSKSVTKSLVIEYNLQQQEFIDSIDKYKLYLYEYLNQHDTLTELPLRKLLYQEFHDFVSYCEQKKSKAWVLMIDIDHFKNINDRWGHNHGDEVLRQMAKNFNL
ncbi:TPA: diguanylate cyclase [Kluyvera georgiana]|nr:diguanylate cyclase [Kluyvera georgiana]